MAAEKPDDPRLWIPPPSGSSDDYLRDTDPARIFAARDRFAEAGFAAHGIAGTCMAHDGLIVEGQFADGAPSPARLARVEELARYITPEVVGVVDTPLP